MALDPETAAELRKRLKFYQEMGIDPFYRREIAVQPAGDESAPGSPVRDKDLQAAARIASRQATDEDALVLKQMSQWGPAAGFVEGGEFDPAELEASGRQAAALDRDASLRVILEDIGADCQRCKLGKLGRKQIVFGTGDPHADLMFIGEGPGADEDAQGLPFVGRAGQLLNNMIAAMGLKREQVYIANIVKCRPPQNRTPERDECDTCSPFLMRQIGVIRPKIIVALGSTAAKNLLGMNESMGSMRGRLYDFSPSRALLGSTKPFECKLAVTYHPAFLLRDPRQKKEAWKDLQMVMKYLGLKPPARPAGE